MITLTDKQVQTLAGLLDLIYNNDNLESYEDLNKVVHNTEHAISLYLLAIMDGQEELEQNEVSYVDQIL